MFLTEIGTPTTFLKIFHLKPTKITVTLLLILGGVQTEKYPFAMPIKNRKKSVYFDILAGL